MGVNQVDPVQLDESYLWGYDPSPDLANKLEILPNYQYIVVDQ